jgi:hypothetical protein
LSGVIIRNRGSGGCSDSDKSAGTDSDSPWRQR